MFKSMLGNVGLLCHLLLAPVANLDEAVKIGTEFLYVGTTANSRHEGRNQLAPVDTQEDLVVRV